MVRGLNAEIRRLELETQVRARLSPASGVVLDTSAHRLKAWYPASVSDEFLDAVKDLRSRDTVRTMGHEVMKNGIGLVLAPLLDLWLQFAEVGPAALLSRVHIAAPLVLRGMGFEWVPGDARRGVMILRCEDCMRDSTWALWEGVLHYAFDLTHVKGTVSPARPAGDGRSAEIDVSWEPPTA